MACEQVSQDRFSPVLRTLNSAYSLSWDPFFQNELRPFDLWELLSCGSLYYLSSNADQRNPNLKHWLVLFMGAFQDRELDISQDKMDQHSVVLQIFLSWKMPEDLTLLNENKTIHRRQRLSRFFSNFSEHGFCTFAWTTSEEQKEEIIVVLFKNCQCLSLCAPLHSGVGSGPELSNHLADNNDPRNKDK